MIVTQPKVQKSQSILNVLTKLSKSPNQEIKEKCEFALMTLGIDSDVHLTVTLNSSVADAQNYTKLLRDMDLDGNIRWSDVRQHHKVGDGVFGDVWKAEYHGYTVACKVLKTKLSAKDAEKTIEELRLMKYILLQNLTIEN